MPGENMLILAQLSRVLSLKTQTLQFFIGSLIFQVNKLM